MEKTDAYRKGSGSSKKWDGGGPGSGPYGGGPRGPPRGLDNVRGIDHSMLIVFFDFLVFAEIFFEITEEHWKKCLFFWKKCFYMKKGIWLFLIEKLFFHSQFMH